MNCAPYFAQHYLYVYEHSNLVLVEIIIACYL
jgi:hypothetical protein